jgi:homocysteine S-methyltransferase
METSLIFRQGVDLPAFAAFPLIETESGRVALRTYFEPYLEVARKHGVGFVLGTPTWRANPDWGAELGYDGDRLRAVNRGAAAFVHGLAGEAAGVVIEGVLGPRGDGYQVGVEMTPNEAAAYHADQIGTLVEAGVQQLAAITLTYPGEATGFVRVAAREGVPATVGFTVETDGRLPSGHTLRAAIEEVDAATDSAAAGFMINCAHPTHFADALEPGDWLSRITGIRANASTMSHRELDNAEELDAGDPADLAQRYRTLLDRLPALSVLGGCCGTDDRHISAIADACLSRLSDRARG